ncbi:calpain-9-like [Oppia nitens]|uniref:calpain-9-like n=1 Tax=Oppia nitens TaxID=1686743 RepID=UPI0023DA4933|nr:calpain-9-like [Oppia nitens]
MGFESTGCCGDYYSNHSRRAPASSVSTRYESNGGHQYYCNSQITTSNISNNQDLTNFNNYNHLWKLCRERGVLFEDISFPTTNKILFGKRESSMVCKISSSIVWMRPFQLVSRPKYINYNPNRRFDLELGEVFNMISTNLSLFHAISIIYSTPKLFERVVNPLQNFNPNTYSGIWRFRFWKFGQWVDIVIDDRLPTYKGRLLYMQCSDSSEFWAALLEKAYAKLYGSYDYYLKHCFTAQTTQDLTGGIAQSFTIANHQQIIIQQMITSAVSRSTLLSVCINHTNSDDSNSSSNKSYRLRNGLYTQQSYLITGLTRVRTPVGAIEVQLVRLRNIYCRGEWNGPWSERSLEWDQLTDRDREELSIRCRTDGEFWISLKDLVENFTNLDLIHIGPDDWMQEVSLHHKQPWRAVIARRKWKKGFNAGGGPSYKATFHTNPQFYIHIPRTGPNKLHVVVSLTQLYETNHELQELSLQNIGFCIYEVPPNTIRLTKAFITNNEPLDMTDFTATRESVTFFALPAGNFIIVPTTDRPHCETRFFLRLFTDQITNIWEVNDDNSIASIDGNIPKLNGSHLISRLTSKLGPEFDAYNLYKFFKLYSKREAYLLLEKPTIELCRYLIMLNDLSINGKITANCVPNLLNLLHFWRSIFTRYQIDNKYKICCYSLRNLLYESGISVSNKVLESLVIRYTESSTHLTLETFIICVIKLHLSHQRYKSLERQGKHNSITLEEMILSTVYS